jgi:hypothetical protein
MAFEWKEGTKRFGVFGARWDGKPRPEDGVLERTVDEPMIKSSNPLAYTEDEELAMGQFVLHQESQGKHVTGGSWAEFAEVVSILLLMWTELTDSIQIGPRQHWRNVTAYTK